MTRVTNKPKLKLRKVRSVEDLRGWWHTVVDVKVKAIVLTGIIATFVVVGFQYQVNALTNDRLNATCDVRIETRKDLREVLGAIVDLSDLFPDNEKAEAYTESRLRTIDELYAPVTRDECV